MSFTYMCKPFTYICKSFICNPFMIKIPFMLTPSTSAEAAKQQPKPQPEAKGAQVKASNEIKVPSPDVRKTRKRHSLPSRAP
eukprot:6140061-Alexandrium_andersonii.AAC.1